MTITTVATFSLSTANRLLLNEFPADHPFAHLRRAWVGFDTHSLDLSPLHHVYVGASLVERCFDWDEDGRDAELVARGWRCTIAPTLETARRITRFVRDLHQAEAEYALCAHCELGRFRSGAVAEWARSELGVPEHPCSERLIDVDTGGPWTGERTVNLALLRLLRSA